MKDLVFLLVWATFGSSETHSQMTSHQAVTSQYAYKPLKWVEVNCLGFSALEPNCLELNPQPCHQQCDLLQTVESFSALLPNL